MSISNHDESFAPFCDGDGVSQPITENDVAHTDACASDPFGAVWQSLPQRMREKNQVEIKTLYLVATPIGNLMDLSLRALKILREVDFIAAEDTRNTGKLLTCFGISRPLVSYHEHNKKQSGEQIVRRLAAGESCALVTDAGTPAISDPGADLVRLCVENDIAITAIPGCCAAIDALALSGLDTSRFVFEGFLPAAQGAGKKQLEEVKNEMRTLIFYEAPHRLQRTLSLMLEVLGERQVALCRELTKQYESIQRVPLSRAVSYYEDHEPRGEYVLVVSGASRDSVTQNAEWREMSVEEHVEDYLKKNPDMRKNDAIKAVARDRGVPKSVIYDQVCGKTAEKKDEP